MMLLRVSLLLSAVLLVSGCATVSGWFSAGEDEAGMAEVPKIEGQVRVRALWSADGGDGSEGQAVNLVPAVTEERVYVVDREGQVSALDRDSGKALWRTDTETAASAGPGLDADRGLLLIGSSGGQVIALSAEDGAVRWRSDVPTEVLSVPQAAQGVVVAQAVDGSISGLSEEDGSRIWLYSSQVPVLTLRGTSTPRIESGVVVAGLANGRVVALDLRSGRVLWEAEIAEPRGRSELERMVDVDGDPLVAGGLVFAAAYQGNVAAVDPRSGSVLWRRELSTNLGLTTDFVRLYLTDAESQVWALHPENGQTYWKQDELHGRRLTAPTVYDRYLVVGDTEGYVYWISTEDGSLAGLERVDRAAITARPVVFENTLYVLAEDGTVSALQAGED